MIAHARTRPGERAVLRKLGRLHWELITIMALLCLIGFAMLYSAAGGDINPWAGRQAIRFAIAVPLAILIAVIDIRLWFRYAYIVYWLGIVSLIAVELAGFVGMGAQRWISIAGFTIQPSEFMKLFLIIVLARYFHAIHAQDARRFFYLIIPAMLLLLPVYLVYRQPNLGTAAIIGMIGVTVFFMAGIGWKKFAIAGVAGLASLPLAWQLLHDYQKQRVLTFLQPEKDPLGAGYNILQSKIAIGSGSFWGKGFLQGTQSQLSFLPEKQTDFIFTMYVEEFGFIGGIVLLFLYAALLVYSMRIAVSSRSFFGKLIAVGITSMLFFHIFINMAMVMGMIPVVGVPLPFLSYGGSSMMAMVMGIGFLLNIHVHQHTHVGRTTLDQT